MNIHEFLGNDLTSCYKVDNPGTPYAGYQAVADQRDIEQYMSGEEVDFTVYYMPAVLSFGDYDNSCQVERSNVRVFLDRYKDVPGVRHHSGSYGHEAVWLDLKLDNEEIIECLTALANYPAMDDEDCSRMEMEIEQASWEGWLKRDFKSELAKVRGVDEDDLPEDDNMLWELYRDLKGSTNTEFVVEAGGNGYVNIGRLLEGVEKEEPEETHAQWFEDILTDEMYAGIEWLADHEFKALGIGKDGKAHFVYRNPSFREMGFHVHLLSDVMGNLDTWTRDTPYKWYSEWLRENGYVLEEVSTDTDFYEKLVKAAEYELLLNDARGQYIPRDFEAAYGDGVEPYKGWDKDRETLKNPDDEWYWEAWNSVLDKAVLVGTDGKRWRLHQDGDLWVYEADKPFPPRLSNE